MGTRGSCWSITINNPTEEDYNEIEALKAQQWVKSWEGQLEQLEGGTVHIQACLKTDYVRWGRVKNALTRAHVEKANNAVALTQYVHKNETRVAELPSLENRYMNISTFYGHLAEHVVQTIASKTNIDAYEVRLCLLDGGYKDYRAAVAEAKRATLPLQTVNEVAGKLIAEGAMGLEFIVTNPATKTMFKTFFWQIVERSLNAQ